jgi:hypothetical protein
MKGMLRHKKSGVTIYLKGWEVIKDKETLFTTHDGVEMVLGQKFWFVAKATWAIFSAINYVQDSQVLYFSSEQRAKEYVDCAKNKFLEKKNKNIINKFFYFK